MANSNDFKEKMAILGTPYKHSSAYKIYGDGLKESPKRSVFWENHIGYIEKYELAKFQSEKKKN